MKQKFNPSLLLIVLAFIFLNIGIVSAQAPSGTSGTSPAPAGTVGTPKPTPTVKLDSPIKAKSIQTLLFQMVDLAIFIGAILAVFMFIWIGFKFVMARGGDGVKEAKEWFMWAVIGVAILMSSKVIVEVMKNTLIATGVVDERLFTLPK